VATDVAARGLDLPDLGLVVHADLPVNRAGLLHRSGRTGRAGRKGVSVLLVPYPRRRRAEQLLASANIEAAWSGPPAAEEIRQRDQQRLLDDPMLTEAAADEDLALARALIEQRGAEQIAAALIRLHRSSSPAPEELFDAPADDGARRERRPHERERAPAEFDRVEGGRWYRLAVGRSANADPKWLIPLICRLGHVTKKDIGQIRIFDRETKFEIAPEAEARFTAALKAHPDEKMRIEPAGAPTGKGAPRRGQADAAPRRGPPPHKAKGPAPGKPARKAKGSKR